MGAGGRSHGGSAWLRSARRVRDEEEKKDVRSGVDRGHGPPTNARGQLLTQYDNHTHRLLPPPEVSPTLPSGGGQDYRSLDLAVVPGFKVSLEATPGSPRSKMLGVGGSLGSTGGRGRDGG